jgi:prevent-host-death family protein
MNKSIRVILSAEAKNNFGQLLDDVYTRKTRYIIKRFGSPRGVLIPLDDFRRLLEEEGLDTNVLRESSAEYRLGEDQNEEDIVELLNNR